MLAVLVADTVAGVDKLVVDVCRVEGNESQSVGQELVGDNGGVCFDLDKIDSDSRDLGKHYSSPTVGEGKVAVGKSDLGMSRIGFFNGNLSWESQQLYR